MKKVVYPLLFLTVLLFNSSRDNFSSGSAYMPILMERTELEKSVKFREAQTIENPGKIYYKDKTIFLNEKYKGIHIIDNSDPRKPLAIGFINIPGCIDMAVKNNSLMADNATDLVSVDISDLANLRVTGRLQNVFPETTPPDLEYIPYMFTATNRPRNTIIVGWEKE
ncbi:MAG: hypothetical protein JXB34_06375 [Bacteroidales bacterium]|nr:hypothetical protein [Bacteroidales bacterium]